MKKVYALLVLIAVSLSCNAQLLWKVSGGNTFKPSYLFGTIHLETAQYIDSVPGLNEALNEVDAVYGEIFKDDLVNPEVMMKMMKDVMAPADSTIDKLITSEEYKLVDSVAKSYLLGMVGLEQLKKFKPVVVSTQLSILQMQKYFPDFTGTENGIDMALQTKGIALGKHVAGLETVDDQMAALFGAPLTEQAQDLVDFCRNDINIMEYSKMLCNAYHAQDLKAIEDIVCDPVLGMDEEQMDRLANDRNIKWMDKIKMMLPVQGVMIVVGAAHLVGDKGLITQLRELGYTVEPVTIQKK